MPIENWILDKYEDSFELPQFSSFKEFLQSGFSLNKEDRLSSFQLEFTPWLSTVADWIDDHKTEWVYLIQGSQTGKTTLQMAFLLYVAQRDYNRVMWVQSTEEEAKQFVTERLRPYIDGYDPEAISKKGWRIESFKVLKTRVKVGYATNEQTLRSVPAQYVIGDECAVWKHPTALLKKRTRTYSGSRKGIFSTTPPRDGSHHSWQEAKSANFYRWYVPCPLCGQFQPLLFVNLKWEGKEGGAWDFSKVRESTRYKCQFCNGLWHDSQKLSIINQGKAICVNPDDDYKEMEETDNTARTLQISSLYSVFTTWGEIAASFIQAKHEGVESLKIFITDELAEVPQNLESNESLRGSELAKYVDVSRVSEFVPGYRLYTAGVDVQRNGELYVVVVGWKDGVIPTGNVLKADVVSWQGGAFKEKWAHLLEFFSKYQTHLARVSIDATDGLVTQDIFDFCNYVGKPYIPLKDSTTLHLKTCLKTINPEVNGMKTNRTQTVLIANSDRIKDDLSAAFQRQPGEIGAWSFPRDISSEFLKHLTAEHRTTDRSGKSSWKPKYSGIPNHFFSALVYACAGMEEFRVFLQGSAAKMQPSQPRQRIISGGVNIWQ